MNFKPDLSINFKKLKLKNPVIISSGIFGFGIEYANIINKSGAFVTKTITLEPKEGNAPPRISELKSGKNIIGILNSIGLENPGTDVFINNIYPQILKMIKVPVIISISAKTTDEFIEIIKRIKKVNPLSIELNLSCPNIKGDIISQFADLTFNSINKIKQHYNGTLIAKLTPNVTAIKPIAKSAEEAGCDVLSLCNSYPAISIDIDTFKPKVSTIPCGFSGPAIKPIILKLVWEAYRHVKIPIIGIGGICSYEDAIEYILCGASAIGLSSVLFHNPLAVIEIINGIKKYLKNKNIKSITKLIGNIHNVTL